MDITVTKASDRHWLKWMEWGGKTGCHQKPERSFSFHGYQFPICARCTGVVVGYLVAIPMFIKHGLSKKASITGCALMLTDWTIQATKIKESTNIRRFITGIAGGFGIMSLQLGLIRGIIHKMKRN